MLEIFNELKPFFEDNYRRINVREYARLRKISPPSASKRLAEWKKEGLLKKEEERVYIFYVANKESELFVNLSRVYWSCVLKEIGLLDKIEEEHLAPTIILFGSLSKAEVKKESDVDLAVLSKSERKLETHQFERKINRKIQIFCFKSKEEIKNKELLSNILNGYKVRGNI